MNKAELLGREQRSDRLHRQVQQAIAHSTADACWSWPKQRFEELALALFEHQFQGCAAYGRYCRGRGVSPSSISSWREIPAVPTDVFRSVDLCSFPTQDSELLFMTSGTTSGSRGRHYLRRSDTYLASLSAWFRTFLLVGGAAPKVVVFAPSAAQDPSSSLSFMLQWAVDAEGAPGSGFFWDSQGPRLAAGLKAMRQAQDLAQPVLVLGTARALQALLEGLVSGALGDRLELPSGSLLMETGGFKGAARTLSRDLFYEGLSKVLGLPLAAIVSEYGMTELGSQGYQPCALTDHQPGTNEWSDLAASLPEGLDTAGQPRVFVFPPWCGVGAVDPQSLELLPDGERGLLRFWDLSNVDSICAIQTADVGVVRGGALSLLGRAPGATARGCSLAVDEVLKAASRTAE